jgi:nucleotide-binding universal stress UspA family protein
LSNNISDNRAPQSERHVLVALDESENAKRALLYTADFLGGSPGFRVTLLSIIPDPSEDYFADSTERDSWIGEQTSRAEETLKRYRDILIQAGFTDDKVSIRIETGNCPSIADCILDIQKKLNCCTIVVGRRGISKKEEFIFGSTSNRLLHSGKNCAVWVIE